VSVRIDSPADLHRYPDLAGFHDRVGKASARAAHDPLLAAPAIADAFGTTFWVAVALTAAAFTPAEPMPRRRSTREEATR
jgi:hypothetical protein